MSMYKSPEFSVAIQPVRPIARASDRASSHHAADHMKSSGKLVGQMLQVFELVRLHPHSTAFELTDFTKLDRYQIQRRLSDLESSGKVKASQALRRCAKSGRLASTWSVA